MKGKVTVKINLKRPNHNYASRHLDGRHNVFRDHHAVYSLGGVRVPDFEIWPFIASLAPYCEAR